MKFKEKYIHIETNLTLKTLILKNLNSYIKDMN